MSLSPHLVRRSGRYHFRIRIPPNLRQKLRRGELWRTLNTGDPALARKRSYHLSVLTERLWQAVSSAMTDEEVTALVDAWLIAKLDEDVSLRELSRASTDDWVVLRDHAPIEMPSLVRSLGHSKTDPSVAIELSDGERIARRQSPYTLARSLFDTIWNDGIQNWKSDVETVARSAVRAIFEEVGLASDDGTEDFELAVRLMMNAQAELTRGIRARTEQGWRRLKFADPAADRYPDHVQRWLDEIDRSLQPHPVIPSTGFDLASSQSDESEIPEVSTQPPSSRTTFAEAAEMAIEGLAREGVFGAGKRRDDYVAAVRMLEWWHGTPLFLSDLTPALVGRFRMDLTRIPSNHTKVVAYNGLSASEVIKLASGSQTARFRTSDTINNKYLRTLNSVIDWLRSAGLWQGENPFVGISVSKSKQSPQRNSKRNFSDNEVARLLSLPVFTGAKSEFDKNLYIPGDIRIDDWRFWVPLICLFSGMRLNEACGLALVDFKVKGKIHYIHVRDEADGQKVKTEAARRLIPIHDVLLDLGLLAKVENLRALGRKRLFEELPLDKDGYYSTNPSKWLNRLIERAKDADPDASGKLTFHSTRHTVITKLRSAGVRQDLAQELVGHEGSGTGVHSDYGQYELLALKEAIQKITYHGVDIGRIRQPMR